jgi:hypothetical protein
VKIRAYSSNSDDELTVEIVVPEDGTYVPPVKPSEPEEPSEPGNETTNVTEPEEPGNLTINVTHPEEPTTGEDGSPVTGGAVEERPFWKTAAVAFIALIIVGILVLRFILLLKK